MLSLVDMKTPTEFTTIETITNKQIAALRDEAGAAGDSVQVAICQLALAHGLADARGCLDFYREQGSAYAEHFAQLLANDWTIERARTACAEAISDAEAM